jgi:hypothetical protein
VLVFSKTSFQQSIINPQNPRAVYFSDDVSVGFVPGGDVYELLALEPNLGMTFYSMDIAKAERPRLERRGFECMFCHALGNKGAPALVVASVYPNAEGAPAYTTTFINTVDHSTPIEQRWGGWYVTGTHGSQQHLGNAVAADPFRPLDLDLTTSQNVTTLADKFDISKHLTGTSDIVALMTLEHQVGIVNRMNAISMQARRVRSETARDELHADVDEMVDYMLFVGEVPLVEPVAGVSTFTQTFPERGPRDRHGRSLRDFDLKTRMFRYPLSYMIYSELFDELPETVRSRVYQRLYDILTGRDPSDKYRRLSSGDRRSILEIVGETKQGLPDYWTVAS